MFSKEILQALQTGQISLEDAEKALISKNKIEKVLKQPTPSTSERITEKIRIYSEESSANYVNNDTGRLSCERKEGSELTQISVAIIGMSGQFPKSNSLDAYWNNLANGENCISEVPPTRWSIDKYYHPDPKVPGKTYSKWLGVLEDVDSFDPLFFNIAPAEAELMDPQQRLFLENCWHSIEDAGISPSSLSGSRCGVFVGCGVSDYGKSTDGQDVNAQNLLGSSPSILSARISYLLNLKGPCLAIDTACSSALAAIAEACNSLILNTCDYALAGGVQLALNPLGYIMASKAGMFSQDGRCFTFDTRANGYVPGEGVGVVLLKRLSDAIRDRDPIYGVVRGWGINQDGKTNGITAPSVNSQISLEKYVYERFGINPETISMAEAHGTGTKLGDPIEVEALIESFRAFTSKTNYCALGSVKSNIGHLIKAAGIAGVIKILLAMKNRMIPPSINFEKLNEHITIDNSPFYINTKLQPWEVAPGVPRRACISSFGFSGTNAHIVIEQFIPQIETEKVSEPINKNNPGLFVLSAKSKEQLRIYAEEMKSFIATHKDINLTDVIYTLQVGRAAMDHRLAFLADSREALLKALEGFTTNSSAAGVLTAHVKKGKDGIAIFETDEDARTLLLNWIEKKKFKKIAELWVKGLDIDWNLLYGDDKPYRISLPTYPFAKERYWISSNTQTKESEMSIIPIAASIHPLLHQNTSDLSEQRFSSNFTGQEFFLNDHIVRGQRVMPGVAYLEMARAAVEKAAGGRGECHSSIRLKNVVWVRPVIVGQQPVQVHIGIYPEDNGEIMYEIYTRSEKFDEAPIVHSQGSAVFSPIKEVLTVDIPALQTQCTKGILTPSLCYEAFKEKGIEYGPGQKGIEMVYVGSGKVLAKLSLPSVVSHTKDQFMLHPSLMDSALQAAVGLIADFGDLQTSNIIPPLKLSMPFALEELEVLDQCTPTMWAVIQPNNDSRAVDNVQKIDIDVCDETGRVCVRIKGFASRVVKGLDPADTVASLGTLMLAPSWKEKAIGRESMISYSQHVVMVCSSNGLLQERITTRINGVRCITIHTEQENIDKRFQDYAVQVFREIQTIFRDKSKGNILVQIVISNKGEQALLAGLSGLLKTAQLENPKIIGQLIEVETWEDYEEIIKKLNVNSRIPVDTQIQYQQDKRYVLGWNEIEVSQETLKIPWKDQGVYLITGGAGGLGMIFAKEIAQKVKGATLILTGRSLLGKAKQEQLDGLNVSGTRIEYRQVDVTHEKEVQNLIRSIQEDFGSLDGIIHAAGVIRDNFIIKKTTDEFLEVLAPKVNGLVYLDQASKELPLDFFILFSSGAALGNTGQADYSTANAFMNSYAQYRNALVKLQQRQGQTLSINWPLWKEGGMHVDLATENIVRQTVGMYAMQTSTGVQALYQGMASGKDQVMVLEGDLKLLRAAVAKHVNADSIEPSSKVESKPAQAIRHDDLKEKATQYIKSLLSSVIKLPPSKIEEDAPMEKYGIDSIMVMQLTNELEKTFGSLSKTLFFEYQNIQELTEYFLEEHRAILISLLEVEEKTISPDNPNNSAKEQVAKAPSFSGLRRPRFVSVHMESREEKKHGPLDVAIIGVAGRYPQARNLQEFWKNLRDGKNCITEIPQDRWDHSLYFDKDKNKPGKTYSKWGGFLDGVDEFDPLFFNISPREAEFMDPQARLYLQCVIESLEDAGYTREMIQKMGGNIGVYVGVMWTDYALYTGFTGHISSFANRVSYYCNFHGPSIAIDTMCSSSLTAIHLACQSLQQGDSEMAIAGGVNVSVHPNKYLTLARDNVVSSKDRSESFGEGDGYVPAEGVGAVLLKPLSKAIVDGDHIYGVIKGTAINHGGKTNGFFVPNPNAQASVIERAYKQAEINPRTISYVEAAAPGSALGDPIEITALTKAFRKFTSDQQFCAIGSVKSNIGHAEAAAGISQLTKVLLQLKHQELVPSINADPLNPNINFNNTPFYLQKRHQKWNRAVVNINGEEKEFPRRATVSSFGAGGSNAHLIIEEYVPGQEEKMNTNPTPSPQIVVLSAKNQDRLRAVVKQILEFVEIQQKFSLADFAYTLQIGREPFESRLALIANNQEELIQALKTYLKYETEETEIAIPIFTGDLEAERTEMKTLLSGKIGEAIVQLLLEENNLEQLALHWTQGGKIPWKSLHKGQSVKRIALPTYPFSRERYWIHKSREEELDSRISSGSHQDAIQKYIVQFLCQELYLTKDQIKLNKDIQAYGMDSIIAMKLLRDFEKRFQTKITRREMMEYRTINSLSAYAASKIKELDNRVIGINAELEIESQKMSEYINDPGIKALKEFRQGRLTLEEIEKLIDEGELI